MLVLTTFDLDENVYDALRAGASGFLLKDAPEERLTTAIRVVADGGSLFAPSRDPAADRGVRPARRTPSHRRSSTASPSARRRCCGSWPGD